MVHFLPPSPIVNSRPRGLFPKRITFYFTLFFLVVVSSVGTVCWGGCHTEMGVSMQSNWHVNASDGVDSVPKQIPARLLLHPH